MRDGRGGLGIAELGSAVTTTTVTTSADGKRGYPSRRELGSDAVWARVLGSDLSRDGQQGLLADAASW